MPRGGGAAAALDELRRRGIGAATQDRTDQAARRRPPSMACARPVGWRPSASTCSPARSGPGVPTEKHRPAGVRLRHGPRRDAGDPDVSRLHASPPARRSITSSATASRATSRCKEGDIVNVDVTLILDGWHGEFEPHVRGRRNPAPRRAADRGHLRGDDARHRRRSARAPPPATSAHAIQAYVEGQHMSVVRDFCGHGLGRLFHDEPNIVHVGRPGEGIVLRPACSSRSSR